jgi:hypothetical protein
MNFKRLLSPLLAGTLLFAPIFGQPSHAANQSNSSNDWEYITDAEDGTLYFGGKRTTVGKTTVMEIKVINSADGPAGKEFVLRRAFNCDTKQIKGSTGWEKVIPESVGSEWFGSACGTGGN